MASLTEASTAALVSGVEAQAAIGRIETGLGHRAVQGQSGSVGGRQPSWPS